MEFATIMEIMSRDIKIPVPDLEASRIYWDEETQSVKQEIIPLKNMEKSSSQKAEDIIATNNPEIIKKSLNSLCACLGAIEGEPLCRCRMFSKEVGERISLYALLNQNRIAHLNRTNNTEMLE